MLSNYKISSIPITEELYSKFSMNSYDQKYAHLPITNVTWYDAFVFCKWCDCELPTEAEWEFASGKNVESEWCCTIDKLKDYAWYSENSNGVIRDVATLKSNCFGIYDMLGNIWEWVFDDYDENYYSNSLYLNPVCNLKSEIKVCRGGSIHAFQEMCRCSFRYNDNANYFANDLGFRVVKRKGGI